MITLEKQPIDTTRTSLWRSRWAALGAAVAVSLGAGGMFVAQAAPGPLESTIVSVAPERILDTRDPVNLGLPGPFTSPVGQKLQVTGSIPTATGTKIVVPTGATGVLLNVTSVGSTASGFISVRPGDATGAPTTSSLNITAGVIVPNSVQVSMPTAGANAGKIDITYDAFGVAGRTTDVLIDVVGYTTNTGLQQLVATVALKANTADVNAAVALKANAADVYTKAQAGAGYVSRTAGILAWGPVNTQQVVSQLALPAGSYVVNAKLVVDNDEDARRSFECRLRLNTTVIDDLFTVVPSVVLEGFTGTDKAIVAFTSSGTLASAGTANVVCQANGAIGDYSARSITAIQIATLTGSAEIQEPTEFVSPD